MNIMDATDEQLRAELIRRGVVVNDKPPTHRMTPAQAAVFIDPGLFDPPSQAGYFDGMAE